MSDLYFMTVLGNLGGLLLVTGFLCLLIGGALYGWYMTTSSEYDTQDEKELQKQYKIKATRLLITSFISLLLYCFIPSTKEMYAIYGIGGVIDYVKGNEKAKKLPDKVIDALDKYLDEQKGEEK